LTVSDLWLICISVSIFLVSQGILYLISRNNNNKGEALDKKKFVIYRIGSVVAIMSIPFLFYNFGIPIVIASLITGICGLNIVYDLKHPSSSSN
jgi:hypothetical protein